MPLHHHPISAVIATCVITSACTVSSNSPPTTGGNPAPAVSRASCVDAVAREYKVPKESVTTLGGATTMKDGIYVVTLSPGAGRPAVNCTVDENGAVSEVIRAR